MIDDSTIDTICDTIAAPDFDRTDLPESAYRALVEHIGRIECKLAASEHKLLEAERDRAQLATQLAVADAKARAAARCVIAATAVDDDEEPTGTYQPEWLTVLRQSGCL